MIQKPNIVKGIPSMVVRALPTLYYFGRFASAKVPPKPQTVFQSHLNYLIRALQEMHELIADERFRQIQDDLRRIEDLSASQIEQKVEELTRQLSAVCSEHTDILKKGYDGKGNLKKRLTDIYCEIIDKTRILIFDNVGNQEWVQSLEKRLADNCLYQVASAATNTDQLSDRLVQNDFVIFASATPQTIHEDVDLLKTYKKPGLVLGSIYQDEKLDQQTIRNGAWLKSRGFEVLYKIFSPLRLYTTIDKIYIHHLLQSA
ncbi:MAG: hypothetical protein SCK70_12790 [bacterium]|nr:hypothetical protein [bacterium]